MKRYVVLRWLSLLFYALIILKGSIVEIPFILYLFSAFISDDTGYLISAVVALGGMLMIFFVEKIYNPAIKHTVETGIFLCLLYPLFLRMQVVPFFLFNYASFIIPTLLFIGLYLSSLIFSFLSKTERRKSTKQDPVK